ncbi:MULTISPECIES: hypothetical protein [unclassified Aureimonas]|uniref:hypothetical protein n=1 Tax=unclassified Aureimonas TaxID=2615206 RepID=UPI00138F3254|nr:MULTISPECIES: hypothetical protein [unclassified Aureimonas]
MAGLLGEMTLPSHENFVKTDAYPKLMMLGRIAVMPLVREVFGGYKHAETASEEAI